MYKIIAGWRIAGQRELEMDLQHMTDGDIIGIDGDFVEELIMDHNTEVIETGNGELIDLEEALWPTREYYLYYAHHPSAGYVTHGFDVRYEGKEIIFLANVVRAEHTSLAATWSEVIIMRLT